MLVCRQDGTVIRSFRGHIPTNGWATLRVQQNGSGMTMETRIQDDHRLPIDEVSTPNGEPNTIGEGDLNTRDRPSLIRRGQNLIFRGRGRGRGRGGGPGRSNCSTPIVTSPEPVDSPDISSIHSSEELW